VSGLGGHSGGDEDLDGPCRRVVFEDRSGVGDYIAVVGKGDGLRRIERLDIAEGDLGAIGLVR
jgi:hypothetical protein